MKELFARSEDGLVHACERLPLVAEEATHARQAGFTWCMIFFTFDDGPWFHQDHDSQLIEARLAKTHDIPTCLRCYAAELTSISTWDVL